MANRVQKAIDLLRGALRYSRTHDQPARAHRIRKGIDDLTPPPPPPPPTKTIYPAIIAARSQSHEGPQFGVDECLMRVRECYGIASAGDFDGDGDADAWDGWQRARLKHRTTAVALIPRGFPVFWQGGSNGHGHVAISAGNGFVWSTDIERPGFFDYVPITQIHDQWGLTLVGWTGDLNGVTITPSKEIPA